LRMESSQMMWLSRQIRSEFARHDGTGLVPWTSRSVVVRQCRRLLMLPDSFSHLHYLHHVFHHTRVPDTRSMPPAWGGFVFDAA